MNTKLQMFVHRYLKLLVTLGITIIIGGIALAYFTLDAEPWETIGGILSAIGLFLTLIAGFSKRDQEIE